ncbi:HGxxPAAW family protein [Agilicoccus flavus]|uniref:HGxxPAAW family protein n=1 Tax=Agilicoccus flavus TaxID=2775968 RepID=UPI001CF6CA82|nr:HGxxPAAW family protein [Agilicoccus flavus]
MADAHAHAEDHGHSPAAWTGVGILLVASALICLGMVLDVPLMWMVGIVGIVVGAAAWVVLAKKAASAKAGHEQGTTAVR